MFYFCLSHNSVDEDVNSDVRQEHGIKTKALI